MTQAGRLERRPIRWRRPLLAAVSLVVFVLAARVLVHEFRSLSWAAVVLPMLRWRGRLMAAVGLCGASFGVVGVIEWRALRWADARAPIGEAFRVSFIANGLAHSLGAAAVVAGAVRARLYARHGVGLTKSTAVTAFQTATSTSGFAVLVGVGCLFGFGGKVGPGPIVGVLTLSGVAAYLLACGLARGRLRLWAHSFSLPSVKDALVQIGLGTADNALAIGSLWVLLPARSVAYPSFVADYVIAYVGGAGPFEGLLVKFLPTLDRASLGAALLAFRLVFNLAPLLIAGGLLLWDLARHRDRVATANQPSR